MQPDMLQQALQNSLWTLAAFDGEKVVGLLRAVRDGASILFIQDILVLPSYQRQGIGKTLLEQTLSYFSDVYQIHLLPDNSAKTIAFYQSLDFTDISDLNCLAFTYMK